MHAVDGEGGRGSKCWNGKMKRATGVWVCFGGSSGAWGLGLCRQHDLQSESKPESKGPKLKKKKNTRLDGKVSFAFVFLLHEICFN